VPRGRRGVAVDADYSRPRCRKSRCALARRAFREQCIQAAVSVVSSRTTPPGGGLMNPASRLSAGVLAAAAAVALTAHAGPEKITFPENYDKGVLYATVDRADTKQYRELYTSAEVVKAVREGKPVPHGTVLTMVIYAAKVDEKGVPVKDANGRFVKDRLTGITVMQKGQGWGAEYPPELRNGEWEYSSFTPDKQFNPKANFKACFECHKPHEKQDYVISLAKLAGTFPAAAAKPKSGATDVNIAAFVFGPGKITVAPGQSVSWTNTDDSPHQISVAGRKTGVLLRGQSEALAFNSEGLFDYICSLHPSMKGQVEVKK
jgi:plastocyanin